MTRVLAYHGVDPEREDALFVHPRHFARQIQTLRSLGLHFRTLDEAYRQPGHGIALTFDDGYADFQRHAFALLQKWGLPSTVFLIARRIGQKDAGGSLYLGHSQIRELQETGLVEFGSHTLSHEHLHRLSEQRVREELRESKSELENLLGRPVRHFCYPAGRHTEAVLRAVFESGYETVSLTPRGDQVNWLDPAGRVLLRTGIYRRDGWGGFLAKRSPLFTLWRKRRFKFAWAPQVS